MRMSSKVISPYPIFNDVDGDPLDAGYMYIGETGKNPEVYPVPVFFDENLSIPAPQPIRTRNGYISQSGKPAKLYIANEKCSVTIKNKRKTIIWTDLNADLGFTVDGLTKKLKDYISHTGSRSSLETLEKWNGRAVHVDATGAIYIYDSTKSAINDGFYVLNGWVLSGYQDKLLATLADLKGDGSNEYTKLSQLFAAAVKTNTKIDMCGLNVTTTNMVATGDLSVTGKGQITLLAGTKGTLLTTAFNLECGEITLDQNRDNNTGGTITTESDCAIKHTGDNLILKGTRFKPSTSVNISTRAKKTIEMDDVVIDGGRVCLYAIPGASAKVSVTGGEYKNAVGDDNIQIFNGEDIFISGITSHDAGRSGIVVSNTTKKTRIIGNLCYGNKKDTVGQGGWGIVLSVNTLDTVVSSNICIGNQTGGITFDTFPAVGVDSLDNKLVAADNIINGLYNSTYSTTGISLNDATHAVVTGNNIYKVGQGIACDSAHFANISGNTIQDVTGYFIQLYRSNDCLVADNILDGCSNPSGGALSFADSSRFKSSDNKLTNLTGAGNAVRISGTSADWDVTSNKITRSVASSGFVFHILGAANTGGVIKGNTITSSVSGAWQWYIASDNAAQFSSHDNHINAVGTSYIFQGNNATAGDDTMNNSRNNWGSAPAFKSRVGQVAVISNAIKFWNGSSWA